MNSMRWRQIEDLYHAALDRAPGERAAFLDAACDGDSALRQEVESLLAYDEQAQHFITTPPDTIAAELLAAESPIGSSLGHYQILSVLGKGGMGEVYRARDDRLGRDVAVKLLPAAFSTDKERLRRFEQEARAASALNHPNIITIFDIDSHEAGRFIVMELVVGRTLREVIAQGPTVDSLIHLGGQMAKALSVAHAAGITHRDIKLENIMVRDDGYVKILDFGLARLMPATATDSEATTSARQTMPGTVLGTVAYMSPEQARGETVGHAGDVFALGIVFYELATGQHPFNAATQIGLLHAITAQMPQPPSRLNPEIPAALETLILRMLEKDAGRRPTAREVDQSLNEFAGQHDSGRLQRAAKPAGSRHTVGREKERAELRSGFTSVLNGRGLLLCVTGEPGIGKTTLVEDFLTELAAEGQCTIARGRCSERLAGTEAYLPLLEALESLLQSDSVPTNAGPAAARLLKQIAPTWYAQIVPLSGDSEESARVLAELKAASQERMKRELGAFLQEVARLRPLALFFDDLHWADVSTIDLLSFLAGKLDALKVLIVVTYRPSEMLLAKHPFLQIKPDLQAHGVCRELMLEFLNEAEIAQYLALEFPGHRFPAEFPKLIHAKTEGSPLFMADLVRYLRDHSVIAKEESPQDAGAPSWTLAQTLPDLERELPESVRGMIERKIAQLEPEDRKLLTAASVQGYEFDSAVVEQVLSLEADEVEERLEKLERVFAFVKLTDETEFPNRTLTLRYRFVHVLYQNMLYVSLRATRRATLSREVARTLEGCHGEQRASVANELAALWEAAREYARAAEYVRLAAQQASQVFATQEAAALARRGLTMVGLLPDSRERREQELSLRVVLGNVLVAIKGYAAPEVEQTFSRARELGQQLGETEDLLPALWGLCSLNVARGQFRKALAYGEEFLQLAERLQSPTVVVGHIRVGIPLYYLGEPEQARDHLQQSASLYTAAQHRFLTWRYGQEPGMNAEVYLSQALWLLGHPDQARAHGLEALRLGREVSHANSQAYALTYAAITYQHCQDWTRVRELTEEAVAFSAEHGLPVWLGVATVLHGWAMVGQGEAAEGIAEMRRGLAIYRSTGAEAYLNYQLCLLAEAYGKAGQAGEGLAVLDKARAVVEKNEERFWEAELYRLKGELLLGAGGVAFEVASGVEACFHQAIEIARRQKAKSLELRAVMSLSRWWRQQGKSAEARQMLAGIYGWFTEGFDTRDLKDAKALLEELLLSVLL